MEPQPTRIEADWVWPVSSDPIRGGAVLIGSDGRIAALGSAAVVPAPDGCITRELPRGSLVIPGLINAHTHLELTGLRGRVGDAGFFTWIQHIRQAKAEMAPADFVAAAREGILECRRWGVTAVADTGDTGAACTAMSELGAVGVAYQEVFGPHPDQVGDSIEALAARIDEMLREAGPGVAIGVSPHAPYSVSEELFRRAASFARDRGLPTASHTAESQAEQDLVTDFAGPFAAMWRERGIPPLRRAASTVALLERAGALDPAPLLIHGVRFSADDLDTVRRRGCPVVLCPGSNLRHGHGLPPARALLDRGITVALGTDSVASVADTNMLREARLAVEQLGVSAVEAVRMLTLDGARAIGCADRAGSLEVGRPADICCLRIGDVSDGPAVAEAVIRAGDRDFLQTYANGSLVYSAAPS